MPSHNKNDERLHFLIFIIMIQSCKKDFWAKKFKVKLLKFQNHNFKTRLQYLKTLLILIFDSGSF